MSNRTISPVLDYGDAYPRSRKVYVGSGTVRVPMREIMLSGDEPALRVYDPSGPRGWEATHGLPRPREAWIVDRGDLAIVAEGRKAPVTSSWAPRPVRRGTSCVTQLRSARRGTITPEMEFVAIREGVEPEFVRSEVACGRAIIPVNINHPEVRADDHRPQLLGEDQRQHWQLGRGFIDRGGGGEAPLGDSVGCRYGHGFVDWLGYP